MVPKQVVCFKELCSGVRDPSKLPDEPCERCEEYHSCVLVAEMYLLRSMGEEEYVKRVDTLTKANPSVREAFEEATRQAIGDDGPPGNGQVN